MNEEINKQDEEKPKMSERAKKRILELDPDATFNEDGTFSTCIHYGLLQDIFECY